MKTEKFCIRQKGEAEYVTFPILEETGCVRHLFTTRKGGVSRGIFSSMNLSFTRGDEPEAVKENYRRIAEILQCSPEDFVCADQTHTTNIRRVTWQDRGKGVSREKDYRDVDGLITDVPGIVLVTFFADCVPLYFVDEKKRAVGLAHSGYKGTRNRMGRHMVEAMCQEFGSHREDIKAVIGPSICVNCYEVGAEVAKEFAEEFPEAAARILKPGKQPGKYQLDLWETNVHILLTAGIRQENLMVTDICTCCNPQELFSHRASGGKRGNLGAFLGLRKN